jgi:hypothetical protein
MQRNQDTAAQADAVWGMLHRIGGISAELFVALLVLATALALTTPAAPAAGGAATLEYIASNRTLYIVQQQLSLVPGILATFDPAQRIALVGAAEALIAISRTPTAVGILTTVGMLIVSLVMLRGVFPRWTAYLGVAAGILGVAGDRGWVRRVRLAAAGLDSCGGTRVAATSDRDAEMTRGE